MRYRLAILPIVLISLPMYAQRNQPREATDDVVRAALPPGVLFEPNIAYDDKSGAQKLDLYVPEKAARRPRPAIVIVHGGGWRSGDKRRGQWWRIPAQYAHDGYVAVSINYRLTDEAPWPAQIEDSKAAVRWLRANAEKYGVDPNRIGAYGNSAGAHLVALLGLVKKSAGLEGTGPNQDQSSLVEAVCASATPTDFLNWSKLGELSERLAKSFFAGPPDTLKDRARQASPIDYVAADAPPFLLIHGTADKTVPKIQSDTFAKALREAGAKQVRYMIFDNESHGVFQRQQLLTYPAMKAFFDKTLGN